MKHSRIFLAQALDNFSPDYIEVDGSLLSADDTKTREKSLSRISSASNSKSIRSESAGISITKGEKFYIAEVLSQECDALGRLAPIVFFLEFESSGEDDISGENVAIAVNDFLSRINRTIQPAQLKQLEIAFENIKKKTLRLNQSRLLRGVVIACVVLVMAWLIL